MILGEEEQVQEKKKNERGRERNDRGAGCMNKELRKDLWKQLIFLIHHWDFVKIPKESDVHLNLIFFFQNYPQLKQKWLGVK